MSNNIQDNVDNLFDGRRSFDFTDKDGKECKYFIATPSSDDIRKADWEHAKAYNSALKEGVLTSAEMTDILKRRNIIGPDYEDVGNTLKEVLRDKIIDMEREVEREARLRLAVDVAHAREEVIQWGQRLSGPMAHTCESIANDVRSAYLTSVVIQDEKGNKVWKSFEDFKSERNLALQARSRFEVMLWMEGLDADFLDKSPENIVMREVLDSVQKEQEDLKNTVAQVVSTAEVETPAAVGNNPEDAPKKRGKKSKAAK
jgi:hypothetical protein